MGNFDHLSKEDLILLLERREREASYGLVWERKAIEKDRALNDDFVALEPVDALSEGDDAFENLIIEGDNYGALRFLRMTHAGKIKCIYIDPPYNTGNRDFVYNDRFFDANDRFRHSVWLEFMYQRLMLARDLLHPEGVIFVSIDDHELFQLGMLMNRIFGERNYIANVIWQKVFSPKNSARHFSVDHDYLLVYASNSDKWTPNPLPRTEKQDKGYKNPDDDPRGPWTSSDLSARNPYSEGVYPIVSRSGKRIDGPPSGRYWIISKRKFLEFDSDGRIWWGKNGNNQPRLKRFLSEVKGGRVPQTFWPYKEVGHTQEAKKEILDILDFVDSASVFSTPKPTRLIERILRIATDPDDIVLDFFAGSGTTAHAVLKLNKEDGGNRRFIMVSNAEATEDEPEKNLCRDVCAERVRRVICGYRSKKDEAIPALGGDFAYLRTSTIPPYRLSTRLKHEQVWYALQLMHDYPLCFWSGGEVAWRESGNGGIAYIPVLRKTAIENMARKVDEANKPIIVYTWSPERLKKHLKLETIEPIPETLSRRFRR